MEFAEGLKLLPGKISQTSNSLQRIGIIKNINKTKREEEFENEY